jgi:hypothetical protein
VIGGGDSFGLLAKQILGRGGHQVLLLDHLLLGLRKRERNGALLFGLGI